MDVPSNPRLSAVSPVHLHVEEETPVHVHVLGRGASNVTTPSPCNTTLTRVPSRTSVSSRPQSRTGRPSSSRSKSGAPSKDKPGPWIPPPGKTTKVSASSTTVSGHPSKSVMFDSVAPSEIEDEEYYGKTKKYESKIESLMSEAGDLKSKLDLERTRGEAQRSEEELAGARKVMYEQEKEIHDFQRELEATAEENRQLRIGLERLKTEGEGEGEGADEKSEREGLLKKLVEVEMDAGEALNRVNELKDLVHRLREDKKMSASDSAELAEKRTGLVNKLEEFEAANRELRNLLQSQHRQEVEQEQESEQRQMLLRKLTEVDSVCQRQQKHIDDKGKLLREATKALEAAQDQNKALLSLQTSLEQTRGHLQREVHKKEGDINRLQVTFKGMEGEVEKARKELANMADLLEAARDKTDGDKEALKKAAKIQKQRAQLSEQTVATLNQKLIEKDDFIAELRQENGVYQNETGKGDKDKELLEQEVRKLRSLISEMEQQLADSRTSFERQTEELAEELKIKLRDAKSLRAENERLTSSLHEWEEKLRHDDDEIRDLRSKLKNYEDMVEEYQSQAKRANQEFEDVSVRLQQQEKDLSKLHLEGEFEVEKVKMRLQQRVKELEPLPDVLKDTEIKLQEAQSQIRILEKQSEDKIKATGEMKAWLDHEKQGHDLTREKMRIVEGELRETKGQLESYRKKMQEAEEQVRSLSISSSRQNEQMRETTHLLDEKTKENATLLRQLEAALTEGKRSEHDAKEKSSGREREHQSQLLQMETQLSHSKTETCQAKREKEDIERRLSSKMSDLKDRLEQSYSTNRSMQNYVHFLKTSYANVFGSGASTGVGVAGLQSDVAYLQGAVGGAVGGGGGGGSSASPFLRS